MLFDKFNMDIENNFEIKFAKTYPKFTKNLVFKIDNITPQEIKICMCIKMSFSNEYIREFLKISERTLANVRSGLRKKLGLKRSESLTNFILCI